MPLFYSFLKLQKTRLRNLVISGLPPRLKRDLLCYLRLLRDNDRHDQVDDGNTAKAREKRQHKEQLDDW